MEILQQHKQQCNDFEAKIFFLLRFEREKKKKHSNLELNSMDRNDFFIKLKYEHQKSQC